MKDYSFGNYIYTLRARRGLSQFQLGTLVGVTDKAVSKWENSAAKPRMAICYRLAEVLGVSINDLLSCEHYITAPARKEIEKIKYTLWREAYKRLSIYGEMPPAECFSRLAAEEVAMCGTDAIYGFAAMEKMQEALREHNTIMIATGTVNSSFTAWLFGGTKVNPLPPHYRCPKCRKVEFSHKAADGFDLPIKRCTCGGEYIRDGHNLPFQGYAKAEQDGTNLEFRISKKALPIAVKALFNFYEGKADLLPVKLISNYDNQGVDRYVVLPGNKAKPPLSADGFWHVNMEDYWKWQENETTFTFLIHEQLNKLDQMCEMLDKQFPDPLTLATPKMAEMLFQHHNQESDFFSDVLRHTNRRNYDLLFRIDSMERASGAWDDNGEQLVTAGIVGVHEIPAAREDIWNTVNAALIKQNIHDSGLALLMMEKTRKGQFHSRGISKDMKNIMVSLELPDWYPDYLEKVRYLFPKGHSIAYLLVDILMEWAQENCNTKGSKEKV